MRRTSEGAGGELRGSGGLHPERNIARKGRLEASRLSSDIPQRLGVDAERVARHPLKRVGFGDLRPDRRRTASRGEASSESAAWIASASAAGSRGGTSHPVLFFIVPMRRRGDNLARRPDVGDDGDRPDRSRFDRRPRHPSASVVGKTTTAAPTNAAGESTAAPTRTSMDWTPHLTASASSSRANIGFVASPASTNRTSSRPLPLISAAASMNVCWPRPARVALA